MRLILKDINMFVNALIGIKLKTKHLWVYYVAILTLKQKVNCHLLSA